MNVHDKVIIVNGGGSGIGAGLVKRFVNDGAKAVMAADVNEANAQAVARDAGATAHAVRCDVSREADIQALVQKTQQQFGRVDIYISNAGILGPMGGIEIDDAVWDAMWKIHGMAHVWAARAVVPGMVAQGGGYFLVTASAAGLLNIVETAPYGVTKHAAVGFAEWLRIAYGRRGIGVGCLCPQSVLTAMTRDGTGSAAVNGVLTPEQVAQCVIDTMQNGNFLCLPHAEVAGYHQAKGRDYDRWLGGMQKLYAQHMGA
jgi:NAD(P)-dependent dehydrogenase (short-subunit alcohol dehydrogenase family)